MTKDMIRVEHGNKDGDDLTHHTTQNVTRRDRYKKKKSKKITE